jgi:hypothetical protein
LSVTTFFARLERERSALLPDTTRRGVDRLQPSSYRMGARMSMQYGDKFSEILAHIHDNLGVVHDAPDRAG